MDEKRECHYWRSFHLRKYGKLLEKPKFDS